MDWAAITKATRAAFGQSVNDWIIASYVQGGWVRGPNAELTPGSLKSSVDVEQRLAQALTVARVPAPIAQALARELGGAWRAWADGFHLSIAGAYPKLAAVPGPMAPPTPASGAFPISRGTSAGELRLSAAMLSPRLVTTLRPLAGREVSGLDSADHGADDVGRGKLPRLEGHRAGRWRHGQGAHPVVRTAVRSSRPGRHGRQHLWTGSRHRGPSLRKDDVGTEA